MKITVKCLNKELQDNYQNENIYQNENNSIFYEKNNGKS